MSVLLIDRRCGRPISDFGLLPQTPQASEPTAVKPTCRRMQHSSRKSSSLFFSERPVRSSIFCSWYSSVYLCLPSLLETSEIFLQIRYVRSVSVSWEPCFLSYSTSGEIILYALLITSSSEESRDIILYISVFS